MKYINVISMLLSVNGLYTLQYMRFKVFQNISVFLFYLFPNKDSSVYMFNNHAILFKINLGNKINCVCLVTRLIVSTFALYFTRRKIISRNKSNVFCICVYNGRYYTLIHRIIDVFFCLSTFFIILLTIYTEFLFFLCLLVNISNKNAKYVTKICYITNKIHVMII